MSEHTGWLLDVYEDPGRGVWLWLLDEDGARRPLRQDFPVTFYAAGAPGRLRALWQYLKDQPAQPRLARAERRDLFAVQPVVVLAVEVPQPSAQPGLFHQVAGSFPDLTYYDADIPLALRYAAVHHVFPLAHCRVTATQSGWVQSITPLDTPWDLDPEPPPVRRLAIEPDTNPNHAPPTRLVLKTDRAEYQLPLDCERPLLINLCAILRRHDPDLILSTFGDTWLLPHLLELSQRMSMPLPLSRDPERSTSYRPERSYFSYGQVIHRGQQHHLYGRWHIDSCNAMLFHDYGMQGVEELARVTALPMQTAARVSPGTGISAMQILTALRSEILVPWHKQQAEQPKTALDLMRTDQGGLVYQPLVGLHRDVAEVDFISMYPSIMARFNISPETVGEDGVQARLIPQLGLHVNQEKPGLVPQTLDPLLNKRITLKARLAELPAWDPRRQAYQARSSAHKWLLVTCFGYLGYKNARFGRIEAHEAVTAYGREALIAAKEIAEEQGCTVLHMYVDGLWVQRPGSSCPADFQPLLDEIASRTSLPIALDGVYRWVAFLPSRVDDRVPVANRYFGVFQDGSVKVRGIEARRGDSPPFVADTQMEMLQILAQAPSAGELSEYLPAAAALLRKKLAALRGRRIPLEELVVNQRLSRTLEEYRTPSPPARAAAQLAEIGRLLKPGQRVKFIYTRGRPGVRAWDLPGECSPSWVDVERYTELLVRAAGTLMQPLGIPEARLRSWLQAGAPYQGYSGLLYSGVQLRLPSPGRSIAVRRNEASRAAQGL